MPTPTDEIALVQKLIERDQSALSILYDRYARLIYTLAYRVLGSAEESEEVVLDVFNQVWRSAVNYNPAKGRVDTWLLMMTRSRALDRLRSLGRAAKVTSACQDSGFLPAPIVTPEEDILILERRDRVTKALDQLPPEQKQVIELAYYQGLTQAQIAMNTGKSLGTIKTRIRLGLSKLRELLKTELADL